MARYLSVGAAVILLILAVAGTAVPSSPVSDGSPALNTTTDMTDTEHGENATVTNATADNVTVDVDCNSSQVNITAPDDYEYGLTVAVVNVTQSGTSTSSSSLSPLSGNASVGFHGPGVVYAFVTNASTGETVMGESQACGLVLDEPNVTTGPSIAIDCNASVVNFTASDDVSYTARVSSVDVTPTGTSSSSVSRTVTGNASMSVQPGLIIASASPSSTDDSVSAIRDCSQLGPTNESRTEATNESTPAGDSCMGE